MIDNVASFLKNSKTVSPKEIIDIVKKKELKRNVWSIKNEISPSDLYCYFYLRFGVPNGIQNFLRADDSDNLIHWDWTLVYSDRLLTILGMNFRTEIHFIDCDDKVSFTKDDFIAFLKEDIDRFKVQISKMQKEKLEEWDVFVNPFYQLEESIEQLFCDLKDLKLDPLKEKLPDLSSQLDLKKFREEFDLLASRYYKGAGLSLSLKMMIPVLAEAFINLLIYILARDDVRNNERLFNSFFREQIDVRIQSLHLKCKGFIKEVNWSEEPCKKYNSIVNQRNDLLHGNVSIDTRKISEVFFNGRVPLFKKYETMWQRSIGISIETSGFLEVESNYEIVKAFIEYVKSCLDLSVRKQIDIIFGMRDLGRNRKTNKIGVLFPNHLVDFFSHVGD